ncbi:uncharacterized protein LOC129742653 [Uranotaenia lowii]|uniref:uncharacterized protein LOC129742653 n=1 Tax=Uranotaenia lowii TaxID=190385 RepID=UPI00247AADF2|nr:uncharacterized protein LOC129742653 [Uranotaenia lowii]
MAQFLANVLQNVVGKNERHVRSSFDFSSEITNVQVPEGCIIYSLDVVSLYTNVPVQNVFEIIEQKWREISAYTPIPWAEFKRALTTILGASFFQYGGRIFEQTFGTPMGSPLSPVVASLLMEQLEEKAIQNLRDKGITLVMYKRYVDDCLIIGNESEIDYRQIWPVGFFDDVRENLVLKAGTDEDNGVDLRDDSTADDSAIKSVLSASNTVGAIPEHGTKPTRAYKHHHHLVQGNPLRVDAYRYSRSHTSRQRRSFPDTTRRRPYQHRQQQKRRSGDQPKAN